MSDLSDKPEDRTVVFSLDHIVLVVDDVERSVEWYREHLGLDAERLDQWRAGAVPFVSLRIDPSTVIDLVQRDHRKHGARAMLRAICQRRPCGVRDGSAGFESFCERHRGVIEMGPRSLFGAQGMGDGVYVRDPDGHRVEVTNLRVRHRCF